jgi:hypothetical protein
MSDARAIVDRAFAGGQPRVGLGTGDLFRDGRSGDAVRLVETAFDAGFRYYDTARLYGDGQAEHVLGAALARRRDQVVIASKAGIIPWSMQTGRRFAAKAGKILGLKAHASAREGAFSKRACGRYGRIISTCCCCTNACLAMCWRMKRRARWRGWCGMARCGRTVLLRGMSGPWRS